MTPPPAGDSRWLADRRDLFLAAILAILAGTLALAGARRVDAVVYDRRAEDLWFQADVPRFLAVATRADAEEHRSTQVHPLFSLVAFAAVSALSGLGVEPIAASQLLLTGAAGLWVCALFALLRLIGCRRLDAAILSGVGAMSAAAVFGFTVPDTYPLGSLSILSALILVAWSERGLPPTVAYVVVSAFTLAITVTNWMAGILATRAAYGSRRTLQITLGAFALVLVAWSFERSLFPEARPFPFDREKLAYVLTAQSGGPGHVLRSFFLHSMAMPAVAVVNYYERPYWPLLTTQPSAAGSASAWGAAAAGLWAGMLALGAWAFASLGHQRRLRGVVSLLILAQLGLHVFYGEETFLYSLHFSPLLIALAAAACLTRLRSAALCLAVALLVCASVNNLRQFERVTTLVECLRRRAPPEAVATSAPPWASALRPGPFAGFVSVDDLLPACGASAAVARGVPFDPASARIAGYRPRAMGSGDVLGLIPARGGSKGVPRKNLRVVAGRPLVARAIDHARASRSITRIVVSTDDPEIAELARREGAEVPFLRPLDLAGDATPDLPVFQHALRWLADHDGYQPELVVHLRPTSPIRDPSRIDAAVELMRAHPEADALKSVSLARQTPYKMWTVEGDYLRPLLEPGGPEPYNLPRQALPRVFWQNGYVDVLRPSMLLEQGLMHGRRILAFEVDDDQIDIDDEESLERAERALSARGPAPSRGGPRFSS